MRLFFLLWVRLARNEAKAHEVSRAKDTALGREVAVKVLHATTLHDSDRVRRFRQEAQSAALNHPNILTIHFVGEHDGSHRFFWFLSVDFFDLSLIVWFER